MTTQAQTVSTMFGDFSLEDVKAGRALIECDDRPTAPTITKRIGNAVLSVVGKGEKERPIEDVREELDKKAVAALKKEQKAQGKEIATLVSSNEVLRERIGVLKEDNKKLQEKVSKARVKDANNKTPAELQKELDGLKKERFDRMMAPITAFNEAWDKIEREFEFDTKAHNGTGYLDGIIHLDLGLKSGESAKTQDEVGRKIIIQGTPWGNVVVFHRYQPDENNYTPIVSNTPDEVTALLGFNGALSAADINLVFGIVPSNNWGVIVDRILIREARIAAQAQQTDVAKDV